MGTIQSGSLGWASTVHREGVPCAQASLWTTKKSIVTFFWLIWVTGMRQSGSHRRHSLCTGFFLNDCMLLSGLGQLMIQCGSHRRRGSPIRSFIYIILHFWPTAWMPSLDAHNPCGLFWTFPRCLWTNILAIFNIFFSLLTYFFGCPSSTHYTPVAYF